MKRYVRSIIGVFLALILMLGHFNCATIVHGTKQDISIKSAPAQAEVIIKTKGGDVVFKGKTPATAKLQRKNEYDVFIRLEGYKETKVHISKSFDALYLGNLVCGGVVGLLIDAMNGAMNKLEPGEINVTLVEAPAGDGAVDLYAVLRIINADGKLQRVIVPLIPS